MKYNWKYFRNKKEGVFAVSKFTSGIKFDG